MTETSYPVRRRRRAPTHPGALLREDILPAMGLSVIDVARRLHVSRQALYHLLSEKSAISPEMAVRLGKLCGNGPMLWLGMQAAHDVWHAEQRLGNELATIKTHGKAA